MAEKKKTYIAIDLKSFYASVECVARGLDPLTTNLLVADVSKTEKTICLAVTPSLKAYGISGRARLFEALQQVKLANAQRKAKIHGADFTGASCDDTQLSINPYLAIDFIAAPPRMALYRECSTKVVATYLKYVSIDDVFPYSIDEVFIDATGYLDTYQMSAHDFAAMLIKDVLRTYGVTATAGIGENMYLCKVALDITAKHIPADKNGVRIAELDRMTYCRTLWTHRDLTDFWMVGSATAKRLRKLGLFTMGDVARCSLGARNEFYNEDLLYSLFGVNAELLIDHAWGYEPCTMAHIKAYQPTTNSLSTGQVLTCPYNWEKTRLVVQEMAEQLSLDLVEKGLVTSQLTLTIGYDIANLTNPEILSKYHGQVVSDHYGRKIPRHAHGTVNLDRQLSSTRRIMEAVIGLYDRISDPMLLTRRLNVTANLLEREDEAAARPDFQQMDLFTDMGKREQEDAELEREKRRQKAMLGIKKKYGKNAIVRGMDLEEGATTISRNGQIGGHKA